ncbi:MAG: AAA family ATPase [Polyangiaceae bacterium]
MRLVELGLVRFGGFTDKILDLSGPGLHIVFGPNEAGKSTALRGITALLYGVPHRSTDGYLHDDLRLSGRIRAEDGSELAFERKKGRKNTLLAPGGAVLDEAVLERRLGGVTQAMFEATFGLDHERLRRGGEELAAGGGDAGQSLFDAGIGGSSVKRVLDALREADRLYSPRAHARTRHSPNAALRRLADKPRWSRTGRRGPTPGPSRRRPSRRPEASSCGSRSVGQSSNASSEAYKRSSRSTARCPARGARRARTRARCRVAPGRRLARAPGLAERERDAALRDENASRVEARRDRRRDRWPRVRRRSPRARRRDHRRSPSAARRYRRDQADLVKRRADLAARARSCLGDDSPNSVRQGDADVRSLIPSRPALARVQGLAKEQVVGALEEPNARASAARNSRLARRPSRPEIVALWPELAGTLGVRPEVERAAWPALGRIEVFAKRFDSARATPRRMDEQKSALERELFHARNRLRELQRVRDLPSEEKLAAVRQERDRGWARARARELEGQRPEPELLDARRLVHSATALADRLRRGAAADVARVGGLESAPRRWRRSPRRPECGTADSSTPSRERSTPSGASSGTFAPARLTSPAEARELTERWERVSERRAELGFPRPRARRSRTRARKLVEELERSRAAWQLEWAKAVALLRLSAALRRPKPTPRAGRPRRAPAGRRRNRNRCDTASTACSERARRSRNTWRASPGNTPDLAPADADRSASELVRRERRAREKLQEAQEAQRPTSASEGSGRAGRHARSGGTRALRAPAAGGRDFDYGGLPPPRAVRRGAEQRSVSSPNSSARCAGPAATPPSTRRSYVPPACRSPARASALSNTDEAIAELDQRARRAAGDQVRAAEARLEVLDSKASAARHQADAAALGEIRGRAERWARASTALSLLGSRDQALLARSPGAGPRPRQSHFPS